MVPERLSNISIFSPASRRSLAIRADFITADRFELICIENIFLCFF